MDRVNSGTRRHQAAPAERHSVTTQRKYARKRALRRVEGNASLLSQVPVATFSHPTYIREQWLCKRGSRYAKELTKLSMKRRWVQGQLDDKNIDGRTARELLELYNKNYAGKSPGQRPGINDISECAKLVNQHLNQDPGSTAGPVSNFLDDMDGGAVEDEEAEEWNGVPPDEEDGQEEEEEAEEWNGFPPDEEDGQEEEAEAEEWNGFLSDEEHGQEEE
ncbi:MAG: hypothetical protein Q9161_003476 [Pseudevernia consocians]